VKTYDKLLAVLLQYYLKVKVDDPTFYVVLSSSMFEYLVIQSIEVWVIAERLTHPYGLIVEFILPFCTLSLLNYFYVRRRRKVIYDLVARADSIRHRDRVLTALLLVAIFCLFVASVLLQA
jgi:hypothetical protein